MAKLGHLSQAHPQKGGFGVSAQTYTIDKTGAESNDVFQSTADFGAGNIRDVLHAKVWRRIKELPCHFVGRRTKVAGKSRFAHLALGDFRRHVGSHEDTTRKVVSHGFGDAPRNENRLTGFFAKVCAG
ncbi:unnamed protein product [Pseudo-nitzschia multistriata]|uniref:Uncharacterized protein n=1 Tax=Pseudo-nitzschia multistriata TaxID=183589 RepID=A0A448ZE95_9STRA|nr:unnamed protein product [Pseudo-nitzschia multistriata]